MKPYTEEQAIRALDRVAKRWPAALTLFSFSGSLGVIRTEDDRKPGLAERVVAWIGGIPNDGGDPD